MNSGEKPEYINFCSDFWHSLNEKQSNIHNQTRPIFMIALLLGVFPVKNLYSKQIKCSRNTIFSPRFLYSCLVLIGFMTITGYGIEYALVHLGTAGIGKLKDVTAPTIFYGYAMVACYFFIDLSRKWPDIILMWSKVERKMGYIGKPSTWNRYAAILIIFGLGEHAFHNWLNVVTSQQKHQNNSLPYKHPVLSYFEHFTCSSHYFIVDATTYSLWKGIVISLLSLSATFLWTFTDTFIILVSAGLANHFALLNEYSYRQSLVHKLDWEQLRDDYYRLTNLVKLVNKNVNKIIGMSVTINLYFISAQLVKGVSTVPGEYERLSRVFYFCSLVFLLLRSLSYLMTAATLHDQSKLFHVHIFSISTDKYLDEMEKLLMEMHNDFVGLSCFNLFHITRTFIFSICGFVLSYEILFIQINEAEMVT